MLFLPSGFTEERKLSSEEMPTGHLPLPRDDKGFRKLSNQPYFHRPETFPTRGVGVGLSLPGAASRIPSRHCQHLGMITHCSGVNVAAGKDGVSMSEADPCRDGRL